MEEDTEIITKKEAQKLWNKYVNATLDLQTTLSRIPAIVIPYKILIPVLDDIETELRSSVTERYDNVLAPFQRREFYLGNSDKGELSSHFAIRIINNDGDELHAVVTDVTQLLSYIPKNTGDLCFIEDGSWEIVYKYQIDPKLIKDLTEVITYINEIITVRIKHKLSKYL